MSSPSASSHPLRVARQAAGLTVRRLGTRAKVHYSRISLIENGLVGRPDELARLAAILRCSPDDLRLRQAVAP